MSNHTFFFLPLAQKEMASKVAMGGTHFSKAFKAVITLLTDVLPNLREKYGDNLFVVIAFMTDGEDSEGNEMMSDRPIWRASLALLQAFLRSHPLMSGIHSTFHSLAFGAGHDFNFLDELRVSAGTMEGGFQYAEPSDGAAAFKTKLDNIVHSASQPAVTTKLRLRVPGYLTNIKKVIGESWVDGSQPDHVFLEALVYPSRTTKQVFNLVVKKEKSSSDAPNGGVTISDLPSSSPISSATAPAASPTTQSENAEWVTPVSNTVPITYATDYYGFAMPQFPQPGMSYATDLYGSDPYAQSNNFGPQPGSASFDFGPQPGSSQNFGPQPGSSSIVIEAPTSSSTSTSTTSSNATQSSETKSSESSAKPASGPKRASNPDAGKDVEIGCAFIEVEVYQLRTDRISDGERKSVLKVRVDRVHRQIDASVLALEQMKIILERMKTELMQAVLQKTAAGTNWTEYTSVISKFEKQLNGDASALISIGRTQRTVINEASEEVRGLFTELHALLATASRGDLSTTQLARMAEVAHGAQFTKARRGRAMDARATKNAEVLGKEQKALAALQISEDELTDLVYSDTRDPDLAEKLLQEWFCVLTQDNWFNLLLNEKDCVGFGVALRRPEFVVDDPTAIRVLDISLTCVSKSAFEHVLTHKLIQASKDATDPIQAKLAYLGGFGVQGKDLGVVVRGSSNEPINAWLPLYINEQHWRVASAQFNSMTGFLVTANPLGYDFKQLAVYFMILAIMIVRMKVASHRQVELTVQYLRTCIAIANDKGYRSRMKQTVADFVKRPEHRLKDVLPNLLVLLGYILTLPRSDLDEILPRKGDWTLLWLSLSAEIARRALDACSRSAQLGNDASLYFQNLISRLVDGYQLEAELTPDELDRLFSPEEKLAGGVSPLPRSERTFAANFSEAPEKKGSINSAAAQDAADDAKTKQQKAQQDATDSLKELLEKRKQKSLQREAQQLATQTEASADAKTVKRTGLWNDFWENAEAQLEVSDKTEKPHHMEWASLRFTDDDRVKPKQTKATPADSERQSNITAGRGVVLAELSVSTGRIPPSRIAPFGAYYEQHYDGVIEVDDELRNSQGLDIPSSSGASSSANNEEEGHTKKPSTDSATAAARKDASIRARESLVNVEEIKSREFKIDACLPKMIEAVELCENVIANYGQPTLEGLINVMTFMRSWYTLQELCGGHQQALNQLDANLGVAPVSWMVHFRDDWERRPHVRNSFFTFLNYIDMPSVPEFQAHTEKTVNALRPNSDFHGRDVFSYTSQMLQLQMLRSMLAQSAKYATNRDAREAIEINRVWRDPVVDAGTILTKYHELRVKRLIEASAASASNDASKARIIRCLQTEDIYEFIALLRVICSHRCTFEMSNLANAFASTTAPTRPLAPLKLSIFLTGKFVDPALGIVVKVLPGPEVVPGRSLFNRYQAIWGATWKTVQSLTWLTYVRPRPNNPQ